MAQRSLVHFDISERKVLLRLMDIFSVLSTLTIVSIIFQFDYFRVTQDYWAWTLILIVYLSVFSTIFELYDLQKAGKLQSVFQNIILAVSLTVLFYMLTPYFTPTLPENRLQILFFFLSMCGALIVWRIAYIYLISSARFFKRVMLICEVEEVDLMAEALHKADPNYVVVGYVNT